MMKEDMDSERITLNVGGMRHETLKSTLRTFPGTRLAHLAEDSNQSEFFFDRNPCVFTYILSYYRTGKLHCPTDVCGLLFEQELEFWGIDEGDLEACCWMVYHRHKLEELPEANGDEDLKRSRGREQSWKTRMWALFDDPYSSPGAMVVAIVSLLFILISIINTCLVSHPAISEVPTDGVIYVNKTTEEKSYQFIPDRRLFVVESVCVAWFTLEFLLRFITCPNKVAFIKNFLNVVDFVAILPFYLELPLQGLQILRVGGDALGFLRIARIVRLLRVFKLMPRCVGVRVLGQALSTSITELFLLIVFFGIGLLIFATAVYYAERDTIYSQFDSIPSGLWWAAVSMTTLGYGDMVPVTLFGKVVGTLCALAGVLTIALPIPVIMNNYSKYHKLEAAKQMRPKKKRHNPDVEVKDGAQSGV